MLGVALRVGDPVSGPGVFLARAIGDDAPHAVLESGAMHAKRATQSSLFLTLIARLRAKLGQREKARLRQVHAPTLRDLLRVPLAARLVYRRL